MNKLRLAWTITGSGHYIEESQDFLLTLENVDLYPGQAAEEAIKMQRFMSMTSAKKRPGTVFPVLSILATLHWKWKFLRRE